MTYRSSSTLEDPAIDVANGTESTHPLAEAGQQAGESVGHLAERATDIGFRQADRGKDQAAQGLTQVAESVRRLSTDMQESQPQIAQVAETAADQAERIATYLQNTDAREMLNTVEDVARRQPILFLGGAFLLGMAASRFIKAASGGNGQRQLGYESGYGTGYGSGAMTDYRTAGTYDATGPGTTGTSTLDSEVI
jgi:hypothetical protein